ncbi:MAG: hypothetical protein ACP5VE_14640 [Chthonomonadales bacterium]
MPTRLGIKDAAGGNAVNGARMHPKHFASKVGRRLLSNAFIAMVMLVLSTGAESTQQPSVAEYAARFDRMDRALNNGDGYSDALNTKGDLAWGEGYLLRAYVAMAKATDDPAYLDSEVEHFDRILQNRDDRLGKIDVFRKVPMPAWGSDEYSRGRWHVWAVHTGMICLGPAEFVRLVRGVTRWRRAYGRKADEYLQRIEEAVAAHDPDYHDGPAPGEGYYTDPEIGPLPLNQQNALGSVIVELYNITRDHRYKNRAAHLALYFKHRLHRMANGAWEWPYLAKPDGSSSGVEDISHAAIDVDFAARCRWAHIGFNQRDMLGFAATWTRNVRHSATDFADTVAGTGGINTYMPQAAGRWLSLVPFDRSILSDARRAFATSTDSRSNTADMLGIAELARWTREVSKKRKRFILL